MIKEFVKRGLIGIGIGNILSCFIALIISFTSKEFNTMSVGMYVKYTVAASIIGFSFSGASVFFQMDNFSLLKATLLHFAVLASTYYPAAFLAEWIEIDVIAILINVSIFVGTYVLIWIVIMIIRKKKVNDLNKKLQ